MRKPRPKTGFKFKPTCPICHKVIDKYFKVGMCEGHDESELLGGPME